MNIQELVSTLVREGQQRRPAPVASSPPVALMGVRPICPACGGPLLYVDSSPWDTAPLRLSAVTCLCGWRGVAPRAVEIAL